MTKSTLNQHEFIYNTLVEAGLDPNKKFNDFWFNPLNQFSLRLTFEGYKQAAKCGIKFHKITLTGMILPKQMLQLERLFKSPYYIQQLKVLYVTDEQDAVMLQLHGGDLNTYLDNLQDNQ